MPWPLGGPLPPQTPEPIASGSSRGLVAKSCPTLVTPWTVALQAPLSMGFLRQEYRSELAFPSPGDLPNPRLKLASPALADSLLLSHRGSPAALRSQPCWHLHFGL